MKLVLNIWDFSLVLAIARYEWEIDSRIYIQATLRLSRKINCGLRIQRTSEGQQLNIPPVVTVIWGTHRYQWPLWHERQRGIGVQ
jgi:hypothetical protein